MSLSKISIAITLLTAVSYIVCGGSSAAGQFLGVQCPLAGRLPILPGLPAIDPVEIKNLIRAFFITRK